MGVEQTRRINLILNLKQPLILVSTMKRLLKVGLRDISLRSISATARSDVPPRLHPVIRQSLAPLGDNFLRASLWKSNGGDGPHCCVAPGWVDGVIGVRSWATSDAKADDASAFVGETLQCGKGLVEQGWILEICTGNG